HQAHEPCEAHNPDVVRAQDPHELAIVSVAIVKGSRADMQRFDAGFPRPRQPRRVGAIGHDDGHGGVQRSRSRGVDDRVQIGSAAGNENREAAVHRYVTVRSPETTKPIRTAGGSPRRPSVLTMLSASRDAQTMTSPMPMLNARNISSSAMLPRCC